MPRGINILRWLVMVSLLGCALALAKPDLDRMQSLALSRYGQSAANLVSQWRAMIDDIQRLPDDQKLVMVNDFFNSNIRWVEDPQAWGQKDYWATPLETMGNGEVDCEDFAIAKYATLILAGVDVNKLRITYVKALMDERKGSAYAAHMVLAYYPSPMADPMILDNVVRSVRPASNRKDLTPVYGFNSNGLWVGGAATSATSDPGAKLSRWRDMLQRATEEGLI